MWICATLLCGPVLMRTHKVGPAHHEWLSEDSWALCHRVESYRQSDRCPDEPFQLYNSVRVTMIICEVSLLLVLVRKHKHARPWNKGRNVPVGPLDCLPLFNVLSFYPPNKSLLILLIKKTPICWTEWCRPVAQQFKRQRQEDHGFKANLSDTEILSQKMWLYTSFCLFSFVLWCRGLSPGSINAN